MTSARAVRRPTRTTASMLGVALVSLALSCSSRNGGGDDALTVQVLSGRADMVTGGDLLVGVSASAGAPSVQVDGRRVAATFAPARDRSVQAALVSGLTPGNHTISVEADGRRGSIDVVDHPLSGPVFSGPHAPLTVCTTTDFGLAASSVDDDCDAPTVTTWRYVDRAGAFHDLADPAAAPADAASVAVGTEQVPFVVRRETGVVNRSVFTIQLLEAAAHAVDRPDTSGWNGRLVYEFGGGCGTTYTQGFDLLGEPDPAVLSKGYAMATATFNTFQVACNDVLSAETMMMVKEHFAERYGVPELTIGEGGSGGAIQQFMIAQNYPGLLDAIAPMLPFPDAATIAGGVVDCALLNRYYRTAPGASTWPAAKKVAFNGHLTPQTCDFWEQTFVPAIDPSTCGFGDVIQGTTAVLPGLSHGMAQPPADQVYDRVKNPKGVRCTLQDSNVNVYGRDPATGFANRPWDNVGVQYGLSGLNAGTITAQEFLDLNEHIGSFDIDGVWQAARAEADDRSLEISYTSGRVNEGGGDLIRIPIITTNVYTDPKGDIHDRFRVFTIAQRIVAADSSAAPNLVIWTRELPAGKSLIDSLTGALSAGTHALELLDRWATDVKADTSSKSVADKLRAHRPAEAVHSCFATDGTVVASGDRLYERPGPCTDPYPVRGDPRTVAGSPIREDIIKCELQTVDEAIANGIYRVSFTADQRRQLDRVFPDGVCDWTQLGQGQEPLGEPWQRY